MLVHSKCEQQQEGQGQEKNEKAENAPPYDTVVAAALISELERMMGKPVDNQVQQALRLLEEARQNGVLTVHGYHLVMKVGVTSGQNTEASARCGCSLIYT